MRPHADQTHGAPAHAVGDELAWPRRVIGHQALLVRQLQGQCGDEQHGGLRHTKEFFGCGAMANDDAEFGRSVDINVLDADGRCDDRAQARRRQQGGTVDA